MGSACASPYVFSALNMLIHVSLFLWPQGKRWLWRSNSRATRPWPSPKGDPPDPGIRGFLHRMGSCFKDGICDSNERRFGLDGNQNILTPKFFSAGGFSGFGHDEVLREDRQGVRGNGGLCSGDSIPREGFWAMRGRRIKIERYVLLLVFFSLAR